MLPIKFVISILIVLIFS